MIKVANSNRFGFVFVHFLRDWTTAGGRYGSLMRAESKGTAHYKESIKRIDHFLFFFPLIPQVIVLEMKVQEGKTFHPN